MPVTPFHYPIANIAYRLAGINLRLPALIVGVMVPDLEVPFVALVMGTQDRLVLHSLIGAATIGTAIAVALTTLIYPRLVSAILPINKAKVRENCKFSLALVISCLLGSLSHVLLDFANHAYNPIFWPFQTLTVSPIVQAVGGEVIASLSMHIAMAGLFIGLFFNIRKNFWDRLLVG